MMRSLLRGVRSRRRRGGARQQLVCLGDDADGRAIEVIAVEGSKEN